MNPVLTVERVLPGAPARVWTAWTTPEGLAGWWWRHLPGTTYQVDARVGGQYRIDSPPAGIGVRGEYTEVSAPHRFAASWIWIDDGIDGAVEHIVVTFDPHPDGTKLTIIHTGPWADEEPVEQYRQGWTDVLDALRAQLTSRDTSSTHTG
jgi:uncharacterized protein YndB with AHSA1/START domain